MGDLFCLQASCVTQRGSSICSAAGRSTVLNMQQSAPRIKGSIRYLRIVACFNHTSFPLLLLSKFLKLIKRDPYRALKANHMLSRKQKLILLLRPGYWLTESHADYFDLIWICSSSSNKFETYGTLSTREASHQTRPCSTQSWLTARWLVLCPSHCTLFPLWIPVLHIFLLNDFSLSAILWTCGHNVYEGPYFKADCLSFWKLKLFNTWNMNHITFPHMDSVLHKCTSCACKHLHSPNGD